MAFFKKLKSLFKKPKKVAKPLRPAEKPVKKPIPKPKKKIEVVKKPAIEKPLARKKDLREVYKVLKEPHISEKATVLADQDKYIFKVYPRTNKVETKKAIENLYGVRVKDVNIVNVHRKRRVLRGMKGFKTGYKKAIVTLEKGQKIEIIPR